MDHVYLTQWFLIGGVSKFTTVPNHEVTAPYYSTNKRNSIPFGGQIVELNCVRENKKPNTFSQNIYIGKQ